MDYIDDMPDVLSDHDGEDLETVEDWETCNA
jgi:hypothetical protein